MSDWRPTPEPSGESPENGSPAESPAGWPGAPGGSVPSPSVPPPAGPPPQYTQPLPPPTSGWFPPPPAPKPGVIPLRPLGIAEILDGAITAFRRYPKAILVPSFVVALGLGAFGYLVQIATVNYLADLSTFDPATGDAGDLIGSAAPAVVLSLVSLLVQFVATVLLTGVITVVMSQAVLGRPMTAEDAWARVRPQMWRLLGLSLLITISLVGVMVATTIAVVVLGVITAGLGLLLLLGAWVPAAVLLTYWAVAPAALLLEKSGVTSALGRAWALTTGAFWRTFGTLVLMVIVYIVISIAISVPFSAPEIVAPSVDPVTGDVDQTRFVVNTAIASIGSIIVSTVALPFVAGVIALLYIDRRMRTEGLDITLARYGQPL